MRIYIELSQSVRLYSYMHTAISVHAYVAAAAAIVWTQEATLLGKEKGGRKKKEVEMMEFSHTAS